MKRISHAVARAHKRKTEAPAPNLDVAARCFGGEKKKSPVVPVLLAGCLSESAVTAFHSHSETNGDGAGKQ